MKFDKAFNVGVGRRLREFRQQACITQDEMAAILGYSRVAYGDRERGRTALSLSDLHILKVHFGVALDYWYLPVSPTHHQVFFPCSVRREVSAMPVEHTAQSRARSV